MRVQSWLDEPEKLAPYGEVCQALTDGFLAADHWDRPALIASGYDVVGPRPELIGAAVSIVLDGYPRAPRDAPRELGDFLANSDRFPDAFNTLTRSWPVRIRTRRVTATSAREPRDGLPRVDTLPDLAQLLDVTVGRLEWFADVRGWNRRTPEGPLRHYRYSWVHRPGRTPRLLEAPLYRLKSMQRIVLDALLAPMPLNDASHGFTPGRSAVTGAAQHIGREVVISADLVSFFAAVPARRVYSLFRQAGLPEAVAHTLTGVCTHVVPLPVLRAMPAGGSINERRRLWEALSTPHLPQGAPSSPALANLTLRRLDSRLTGWAAAAGGTYTRYADDLAFSGDAPLASRVDAFLRGVERIVVDEGHAVNARKTRVRRQGVRQSVTGIVVNERPSNGRREYDHLKAVLHNCIQQDPAGQNRTEHPDFRAHLEGRVSWFEQVHPERGAKLRAQLNRILW